MKTSEAVFARDADIERPQREPPVRVRVDVNVRDGNVPR